MNVQPGLAVRNDDEAGIYDDDDQDEICEKISKIKISKDDQKSKSFVEVEHQLGT